ncbi:MAG: chemotaxis protein CheW [Rhodocyclaceae bacterium]
MAENINNDNENNASQEYLGFLLGNEEYVIDILKVQEIRGYTTPTKIAQSPDFVKGVINLRGNIVPIVDLRIKFDLPEISYTPFTVVIILNVCKKIVGIVVDSVSDVFNINVDEIKPAPEFSGILHDKYLKGLATVNEKMLIVTDIDALMSSPEMGIVLEDLKIK